MLGSSKIYQKNGYFSGFWPCQAPARCAHPFLESLHANGALILRFSYPKSHPNKKKKYKMSSNPLQRHYNGDFDRENVYRSRL
jgi:hypothetical protein